jgi:hypothetical protein
MGGGNNVAPQQGMATRAEITAEVLSSEIETIIIRLGRSILPSARRSRGWSGHFTSLHAIDSLDAAALLVLALVLVLVLVLLDHPTLIVSSRRIHPLLARPRLPRWFSTWVPTATWRTTGLHCNAWFVRDPAPGPSAVPSACPSIHPICTTSTRSLARPLAAPRRRRCCVPTSVQSIAAGPHRWQTSVDFPPARPNSRSLAAHWAERVVAWPKPPLFPPRKPPRTGGDGGS